MSIGQTVFVVDDDAGMRKSLCLLLASIELPCEAFASAKAFLAVYDPARAGCLILDIRMPEMSGLELQDRLVAMGAKLPIIVVSAHADVAAAVRAMKMGSFDFMEKPYSPHALLEQVHKALERDRVTRAADARRALLMVRMALLTAREREILELVVAGRASKLIADELRLTISTVDNHRANIMRKLQAETAADLTRIALMADPKLFRFSEQV